MDYPHTNFSHKGDPLTDKSEECSSSSTYSGLPLPILKGLVQFPQICLIIGLILEIGIKILIPVKQYLKSILPWQKSFKVSIFIFETKICPSPLFNFRVIWLINKAQNFLSELGDSHIRNSHKGLSKFLLLVCSLDSKSFQS